MCTHRYSIYSEEVEHVFVEKDVGVTMDSEVTFAEHISKKVNVANGIVGLIRRSFSFLDCKSFKKILTAFVRPHLEYVELVWAPHLCKYINMLENVQKRATKLLDGLGNLEYAERLERLQVPSRAYRRRRDDMIELFKHFHTYDKGTLSYFPTSRTLHEKTRIPAFRSQA